jgi:transcriptional regulator with XRE-family HTH domain
MELKDWVKQSREAAKLTQEQLGEVLGRGKATISGWEKGTYEPSYDQVIAIYERTFRKVPLPNKNGPPPEIQEIAPSDLPAPVAELMHTALLAAGKGVPEAALKVAQQMLELMADMASIQGIDKSSSAEDSLSAGASKTAIQTIKATGLAGAQNERKRNKRQHSG